MAFVIGPRDGCYHVGLGPPAGDAARAALEQAIRSRAR
jgi:hypothetical protein